MQTGSDNSPPVNNNVKGEDRGDAGAPHRAETAETAGPKTVSTEAAVPLD
eukprot:SAG31_NODE_823_length_11772_cov_10.262229_9_plen_49_part_01